MINASAEAKERGFTLIEVMISIAVIAVISTVGVITYGQSVSKTRDARRQSDLRTLATALELYNQKNNSYFSDTTTAACQTSPNNTFYTAITPFIGNQSTPPVDPVTQQAYCYISSNGAGYQLFAKLDNCTDLNNPLCRYQNYNYRLVSDNTTQPSPAPGDTITPTPTPTAIPTLAPTPIPTPTLKRVFITSTLYSGNLGGLSGADQKCLDRANATGVRLCGSDDCSAGSWKAWLSSSTDSPVTRFSSTDKNTTNPVTFALLNGTVIATSWADLTDSSIQNFIDRNELGQMVSYQYTWTDTNYAGQVISATQPRTCHDWTSTNGETLIDLGYTNGKDTSWSQAGGNNCAGSFRLFCFEQ